MIVLDTTVLVYAVGGDHPLAGPCRRLVDAIGEGRLEATTTAEVIQGFVHVRARRRTRHDAAELGRSYAELLSPLLAVSADASSSAHLPDPEFRLQRGHSDRDAPGAGRTVVLEVSEAVDELGAQCRIRGERRIWSSRSTGPNLDRGPRALHHEPRRRRPPAGCDRGDEHDPPVEARHAPWLGAARAVEAVHGEGGTEAARRIHGGAGRGRPTRSPWMLRTLLTRRGGRNGGGDRPGAGRRPRPDA